ncbi:MAG: class I SAM-dependent methyltransferase [Myxococcota bacterium]|nr:class I SAM-dependent methyltransferase [Myxococcota bacterium]
MRLGPAEAAIFETFVVPRYLSFFGEMVLEALVESDQARVVHMHCRTGYPDRGLALKLPGAHIVGIDASPAALQLARAKAATMPTMVAEYRAFEELPTSLPEFAFSHAVMMHPHASTEDRERLFTEFARLLAPYGQLVIATPMRGSFQELADLLREYSLKYDDMDVAEAVDHASLAHPTVDGLASEVEKAGFEFVEVGLRPTVLAFRNGRDFFEDPVARLLILPEVKLHHRLEDTDRALAYVREAIDKYWSDGTFELTVNVGCASARRVPS